MTGPRVPLTIYDEGYDFAAFRRYVLEPLGPGGGRRCRPALFDSLHDVWLPGVWQTAGDRTIALIDGVFLLRPDLASHWDYVIWLDIDFDTMVARACERDVVWVGSAATVEDRYRRHWIPPHLLYERLINPVSHAQFMIDNRRPQYPTLLRRASR